MTKDPLERNPPPSPPPVPTDAELVAGCLQGDASAWELLLHRYANLVSSIALRSGLSRDDAADVFQLVSMSLLDHIQDLRDAGRLGAWIATTARRHALRIKEREKRQRSSISSEELPQGVEHSSASMDSIDDALIAWRDQQLVQEAMARLSPRCQRLLELLFAEGESVSYADIAERLQMPVGSIGPTRARCLERLRRILEELGF